MISYAKIFLLLTGLTLASTSVMGAGKSKTADKARQESEQQYGQGVYTASQDAASVEIVNAVLNRYTDWESVSFNGKLRTSMIKLPVTPTVKIYAVKDQLFQLSLSAPFLGEVGRIEITPETIVAINKYNKTYVLESMENLTSMYPGLLGDLQNLFLGRMVIIGQGSFGLNTLDLVTFDPIENGQWLMMPKEVEDSSLKYGYVLLPNGRTAALFGFLEGRPENVTLTYGYNGGMQMSIDIDKGGKGKNISGTLDFSSVKWGGNRMSQINLDRYRKVSFKDFIRNYK